MPPLAKVLLPGGGGGGAGLGHLRLVLVLVAGAMLGALVTEFKNSSQGVEERKAIAQQVRAAAAA